MSGSNCYFLTCIQISQEADQVVWYSHLFQDFLQFVVIYTVKGFGVVNKAEIDVFLELSRFFDDPADIGNLISASSAFSKTSLNIWKFSVHVLLKPGLENFEHYLTSVWDECSCAVVWAFFGIGMKTDLFQSCGHCWVFQIYWNTEWRLKPFKLIVFVLDSIKVECGGTHIISSDHESEDREYHKQIYFQGSFWFYLTWLLYLFCLIPVYEIYGACLSLPFRSISFHSLSVLRVGCGISASRFCWFWSKICKKGSEITVLLPVNTAFKNWQPHGQ